MYEDGNKYLSIYLSIYQTFTKEIAITHQPEYAMCVKHLQNRWP